jgi:hypothetical protein
LSEPTLADPGGANDEQCSSSPCERSGQRIDQLRDFPFATDQGDALWLSSCSLRRILTHSPPQHLGRQSYHTISIAEVIEILIDDLKRLCLRPAHSDRLSVCERRLLVQRIDL